MLLLVLWIALVLLVAFLGYAGSHWIAPAVLFVVAAPVLADILWRDNATTIGAALIALVISLYAPFLVARIARLAG